MKYNNTLVQLCLCLFIGNSINGYSQSAETITPLHKVTLDEAHIGNQDIDMTLLESYELASEKVKQFYLESRLIFSDSISTTFIHPDIIQSAKKHKILLMGGPMLGQLKTDGVCVWLRPATDTPLQIVVINKNTNKKKYFNVNSIEAGVENRILIDGLTSDTEYNYEVHANDQEIAQGRFRTAPPIDKKGEFRLTFGSCFHKIGLHNPYLINQIIKRESQAMLLLGDIAVDDRENRINMHLADYLLRDVSSSWQHLAANLPLYTSWDDHDYLNNDLSGIPSKFCKTDIEALRNCWHQNWNNPQNDREGIYFNTQIGPTEVIMLDTRSCRTVKERGKYNCYLGEEQLNWLKDVLKNSKAPFKIISSGTMWSDDISNGKDSWGTWDTLAREEILSFIETEKIPGVLLISGDRHGARGFTIPRPSGFKFHEFEAASLGGVPGPRAMAKDRTNQIFGYEGKSTIAFGEFTFDTRSNHPMVTFRLISEKGDILEEHKLSYDELTPPE